MTPQQPWIVVAPSGGTLTDSANIQVWVNRELVGRGERTGSVLVSSDVGTVTISVSIE